MNTVEDQTSNTIYTYKQDFPLFKNYPDLVYLDSAATTQKPRCVLDSMTRYYETSNANPHRGVYKLSELSSQVYEDSRKKIANYLGIKEKELVFTSGTTEGINIVANSFLKSVLKPGDSIILGGAEHHANVVPWQLVAKEQGAVINFIKILDDGNLDLKHYKELLDLNPKIVALAHISNVLGTVNPVNEIVDLANKENIPILIDGAQSIGHASFNLKEINCDFFVTSAHKAYGPMGVGCLFIKESLHSKLKPYNTGGGMIEEVGLQSSSFQEMPYLLEAGTQNVAAAHGFSVALEYLTSIGLTNVSEHEARLAMLSYQEISKIKNIKVFGPSKNRSPVLSFNIEGVHAHDVASLLNEKNIAVRAGHHCSQHAMNRFNINASVRASFALYNSEEDIESLIGGLNYVKKVFKVD